VTPLQAPSHPTTGAVPVARLWWLALALALLWLPAVLRGGWVLDDRELIFENPVVNGALPWHAVFGRDYFHHLGDSGQWRPLASLSLRLDRVLWGEWVTGYHCTNVLLHFAVVALALRLFARLGLGARALVAGTVFFALHPLLADSVVWIAGRTSMLSALGPLAGALASRALARRGAGAIPVGLAGTLGILAGLLAKEDALFLAPLVPLALVGSSRLQARAGLVALFVAPALWCAGRWWALGSPLPEALSPALGDAGLLERAGVGGNALLTALRVTVLPLDYPPQYRLQALHGGNAPLSPILAAVLGWGLAACLLGVALDALRRRRGLVAWSALLAIVACSPFTQLVPIGEVFAPRFLYTPLLLAIPLVGASFARLISLRRMPPPSGALVLGLVALLLASLSYRRAGVYANRGTWRSAVLEHNPDDAPSWNGLALYHEEEGDIQNARFAWQQAIVCDPGYSKSWSNLGRVLLVAGELEAAEKTLRQALRVGPRNAVARINLATLLTRRAEYAEAAELYEQATRLSPGLAAAWRGLGQARLALEDPAGARMALERARDLDPRNPGLQALFKRLSPR